MTGNRQRAPALAGVFAASGLVAAGGAAGQPLAGGDDAQAVLTLDHYVTQRSSAPPIEGEFAQIYVRERTRAATIARGGGLEGRVVLFVHGAGTPAEVAFDVPYEGYSWMAYLAAAGYDTFAVDMTGYGRSTRPHVMNDPCNLPEDAQRALGIGVVRGPCTPSYAQATTTIASDWADIDAAVGYIRALRGVTRVSLIAWSLGGPRAGGYAARHPEKVDRLVLLAPAYTRNSPAEAPAVAEARPAMTAQSRADFSRYFDGPAGCAGQRDPRVGAAIYGAMLESDPVGASWGQGIRRAPNTAVWGWNRDVVSKTQTPVLMIAPIEDASVAPERVRELHEDWGAEQNVLIDLGCASHGAMWESVHGQLFAASLEWLNGLTVAGKASGVVRMGYEEER